MPGSRKNGRSTRITPTPTIKSKKRARSNPDNTAEPTAGTSHGQVVGVDGSAATSGHKKLCSKPKINYGSAQFSDIKETDHFVDKTKIVEVLFNDSPFILITRPRRFGKSTIMNMVKEFVEQKVYTTRDRVGQEILRSSENDRAFPEMNLRLFEDGNLEISKWDEFSRHRGKYPTIYLDLQSIDGADYLKILLTFRKTIINEFIRHKYLLRCEDLWSTEKEPEKFDKKKFEEYLDPTPTEVVIDQMIANSSEVNIKALEVLLSVYIKEALLFLAQVLHKHFSHKIYLFIDEYDAPINNTIFRNTDLCKKVNDLLNNFFKNLLKRQDSFIARALITGISYIGSLGLLGVNNVKKHMFLRGTLGGDDRYEVFYGVTEEELEQLTTKFAKKFWQGENKLPKEKVDSYYNGYKSIGLSSVKIYPIWSIVRALENGELSDYWEQSGIMSSARQAFNIPIVRITINNLLTGRRTKCKIPYKLEVEHLRNLSDVILKWEEKRTLLKSDLFLSFLMQQGYLMYVKNLEQEIFEVKIPNAVIENEFRKQMKKHVGDVYDFLIAKVTAVFDQFPDGSDDLDDEIVKMLISSMQKVFEHVSQKWHQSNEDAYHSVIFHSLCKSSKYKSYTELSRKKGILDIAFNSENEAVIIEVKNCKTALTAFEQIESRGYIELLRKRLSDEKLKCVCMGVNVNKNNKVSIAYKNADKPGPPREVSL